MRHGRQSALRLQGLFQFTHPGGVRQGCIGRYVGAPNVSIHAPGRGATAPAPGGLWSTSVSIHAPGRGATSRVGWQAVHRDVSIHAPGRGATLHSSSAIHTVVVSIHAPGRGATGESSAHLWGFSLFQFTHPGGVRLRQVHIRVRQPCVSIHAPGRGATPLGDQSHSACRCFNSRTREGCDF